MAKPQRIRSRIMILIYPNINSSSLIIEHLKTNFKIDDDKKWSYIIRQEITISGQTNTIVFLELNFTPDVYLHKLNIEIDEVKISPSVHSWTDKEFLLRYILTFHETFNINSDILTNFSQTEIEDRAVILRISSNLEPSTNKHRENIKAEPVALVQPDISAIVQHKEEPVVNQPKEEFVEVTKVVIEEKIENRKSIDSKPYIKQKQIDKFNSHYSDFNNIIESQEPKSDKSLSNLERLLRNMTNYRSVYEIPEEMRNQIKLCQGKLKEFKKNL